MNSFETGPIRPPSEAGSYLIRLTRGCPWNKCKFCRTYRKHTFEIRAAAEVMADIDAMARIRDDIKSGNPVVDEYGWMVENALSHGGTTAFLQDGDSLAMKPDAVRQILAHLQERFPEITRITSYARSRTMASRSVTDLVSYRELGLTRIHIGMESGHDPLLQVIKKGATGDIHIRGGKRVIEAGIELSEYIMPGLGGREFTEGHAIDSARILNEINPDFIRLRTICLGPGIPLWEDFSSGQLTRLSDIEIVKEIRTFIEALNVDGTKIASDHILNLLGELDGKLPTDKERLLAIIDTFLALPKGERELFQVARRAGMLEKLSDLDHQRVQVRARKLLDEIYRHYGRDGVEDAVQEMMKRFI
ncbi:MAG: radical SAM protein [Desulfuromonadales bacterium]|nr:radical SAM protein [Desulfuromonadales bacterium]